MSGRSLVVVSAGLRQPSSTRLLADRLADATERHLRAAGVEPHVEVVEVRDHAQDLASGVLTGFPSPRLRETVDTVLGADGVIAVTPVFNASYSGLFKLFFDVLEKDSLAGVPVLLAATGGTARHSLVLDHALRPLFAYLDAATVPTAVYAASADWGQGGTDPDGDLVERIDRAAGQLGAAMAGRSRPPAADPFGDPVPFEELLRGG